MAAALAPAAWMSGRRGWRWRRDGGPACQYYLCSIVTELIVIGLTGRSPGLLVAVLPILFTMSIPSVTSPKTLCLLSSHGVGTSVMKNWPPLVFGPLLAIER